jgi:hypothetical protein
MDNKQVAHLWANKSRERAKGSSFYFEGDTIYSYGAHFPIARHLRGVVLFTSKGYSSSTARHKSYVRNAINHLESFTVDDVTKEPGKADVKGYAESLKRQALVCILARDPRPHLDYLQRLTDEANRFCEVFGFRARFAMPDESTLSALKERDPREQAVWVVCGGTAHILNVNALELLRNAELSEMTPRVAAILEGKTTAEFLKGCGL